MGSSREFVCVDIELCWSFIAESLDSMVALVAGLDVLEMDWKPAIAEANSLGVLLTHTLKHAQQNLLQNVAGEPVARDRDAEFGASGRPGSDYVRQWEVLRGTLVQALSKTPEEALDRMTEHPRRGPISGRGSLLVVVRHAAEHLGHSQLTRDLLRASASA